MKMKRNQRRNNEKLGKTWMNPQNHGKNQKN